MKFKKNYTYKKIMLIKIENILFFGEYFNLKFFLIINRVDLSNNNVNLF